MQILGSTMEQSTMERTMAMKTLETTTETMFTPTSKILQTWDITLGSITMETTMQHTILETTMGTTSTVTAMRFKTLEPTMGTITLEMETMAVTIGITKLLLPQLQQQLHLHQLLLQDQQQPPLPQLLQQLELMALLFNAAPAMERLMQMILVNVQRKMSGVMLILSLLAMTLMCGMESLGSDGPIPMKLVRLN